MSRQLLRDTTQVSGHACFCISIGGCRCHRICLWRLSAWTLLLPRFLLMPPSPIPPFWDDLLPFYPILFTLTPPFQKIDVLAAGRSFTVACMGGGGTPTTGVSRQGTQKDDGGGWTLPLLVVTAAVGSSQLDLCPLARLSCYGMVFVEYSLDRIRDWLAGIIRIARPLCCGPPQLGVWKAVWAPRRILFLVLRTLLLNGYRMVGFVVTSFSPRCFLGDPFNFRFGEGESA